MNKNEHTTPSIELKQLQQLLADSRLIWQESQPIAIFEQFVKFAAEHFNLSSALLFVLGKDQLTNDWSPIHLDGSSRNLTREEIAELKQHFSQSRLSLTKASFGVYECQLHKKNYYYANIKNESGTIYLLIWNLTHELPHEQAQSLKLLYDFLILQLQNRLNTLEQIDASQILLQKDELTGLYNMRYLSRLLEQEIPRAQRFHHRFCLLFIDLDNFKAINDKFGHLNGSRVLQQVADVLKESSREIDTLVRYGGDEFVILLLGASSATGQLAAERIRRQIEDGRFLLDDGSHVSLTASIGVAEFPTHGQDKESLLKLADLSMYEGKKLGKNKVILYGGKIENGTPR